jgi:hypothetical protein
MKFYMYSLISCLLLLHLTIFSSCGGDEPNNTSNPGSSSESKKLMLTPFGELNQGASEINSHANEWKRSILTMNYRSLFEAGSGITGTTSPAYARMIKLADGSYILLNQDSWDANGNGANVFWATSPDMKNWTSKGILFKSQQVVNGLGNSDTKLYTNGFGKVLKKGDVLLFASYRYKATYSSYACRYDHGIEMIKSSDNGETWSEPQVIHRGPNWEAMMLELPSGDIQCYFSESRPHISGSHSGTSMVQSTDGGKTWLPSASGADPYRVIRHTWYSEVQGKTFFTDQMPSLILLNNSSQIAGAFESVYVYDSSGKHFKIAFAWSPEDGKWDYITGDEGNGSDFDVATAKVGPTDRILDRWVGAGSDLKQFPSGETLVSYTSTSPQLSIRIGDSNARQWGEPFVSLPGQGSWGAMMMESSHEVVACMRNSKDSKNITVAMAKWALNHRIKASARTIDLDGDNNDWQKTDEALFVGAKCQAQATLRCSSDANNLYFLIECLDENVSKDDYIQLFIAPSDQIALNAKSIRVKVSPEGLKNQGNYAGVWMEKDLGAKAFASCDATLSSPSDTDNGWLAEIAVPRSALDIIEGKVLVNLALFDMEGGEDAITSTGSKNPQVWTFISGL